MTIDPKIQGAEADDWAAPVNTTTRGPAIAGIVIFGIFVGSFGYWSASAPLAGAAIAPGIVTASGQNLRVQHLEGGIVDEILVREGQSVKAGQALLRLDPTDARTTRNRVSRATLALAARAERLKSERDGLEELNFSDDLKVRARMVGTDEDLKDQRQEFAKRQQRLETDAAILDQSISAQKERILGKRAEVKALQTQIALLAREIRAKAVLLKKGLTRRSELSILQRNRADMRGRIGAAQSSIAEAKTAIVETTERKNKLLDDHAERAVAELNEVRQQISDLVERGRAAENILERVTVRAPADGIVVTMNQNTKGGVVRPGEELMVLLPTGGELVVEARVSPADKDLVKQGQDAKLVFSTLDRRTPEVPGNITYIAADQVIDPLTKQAYFPARLKITSKLPEGLSVEQIFPGLPVETFIKTGDRTFLEYLIKPITDRFNRAFRES